MFAFSPNDLLMTEPTTIESNELVADFVDEGMESLQGLPGELESFAANPANAEPINAVFRAVHSIKGCAGFLGLVAIKQFAHSLENTLDDVRKQRVALTSDFIRLLIQGFDRLTDQLQRCSEGTLASELTQAESELLGAISHVVNSASHAGTNEDRILQEIERLSDEIRRSDASGATYWADRMKRVVCHFRTPDSASPPEAIAPSGHADHLPERQNAKTSTKRTLRVKEERIDLFLDYVARLASSCERLKEVHKGIKSSSTPAPLVDELRQVTEEFVVLSRSLQQSVVGLRKISVATLFAKFPSMARSLGSPLGKQIEVHLSGEELDIDKSLVDDLDAPLTHMVRNVADHGIESPGDRRARGVSEAGNLWLRAERTSTHLVITIQDDGRGIDPDKLRKKAVENGIVSHAQAAALTDQEAVELIYLAGFSTAEKVSEVSGRGVGMDVVISNLRKHSGEIFVTSKVGVGTTFRLEIPKREAVAVIDSLTLDVLKKLNALH
jgi:two-component system chemotaxis sensor kinase CheA